MTAIISIEEENDVLNNVIIGEAIGQLSPRQRTVLGLSLVGYTQAETAFLLQISRSSVGDCYRKCISTIQKFLEESNSHA